jgi:hypothetical protein
MPSLLVLNNSLTSLSPFSNSYRLHHHVEDKHFAHAITL